MFAICRSRMTRSGGLSATRRRGTSWPRATSTHVVSLVRPGRPHLVTTPAPSAATRMVGSGQAAPTYFCVGSLRLERADAARRCSARRSRRRRATASGTHTTEHGAHRNTRRPTRGGDRSRSESSALSARLRVSLRGLAQPGCARHHLSPKAKSSAARARRRDASPASPKSGWTRFTTSAATASPLSRSRFGEELGFLHRVAPRRRHEHEAGFRCGEQRGSTVAARSRKPCSMPSNARKNETTSSMTSEPTTRATVRRNVCTATLATRRYARVGIISKRKMRLSRSLSEPGRVEEVERVAGRGCRRR